MFINMTWKDTVWKPLKSFLSIAALLVMCRFHHDYSRSSKRRHAWTNEFNCIIPNVKRTTSGMTSKASRAPTQQQWISTHGEMDIFCLSVLNKNKNKTWMSSLYHCFLVYVDHISCDVTFQRVSIPLHIPFSIIKVKSKKFETIHFQAFDHCDEKIPLAHIRLLLRCTFWAVKIKALPNLQQRPSVLFKRKKSKWWAQMTRTF